MRREMKRIKIKHNLKTEEAQKEDALRILFVFKIISLISPTEIAISILFSGVFSIYVNFKSSIVASFSVHR